MQEIKKSFNHFKLHTQYSICEGAIKIEDLEYFCKNNKFKSKGISDTSNLCGVLQFSETVSKSKTQPIIEPTKKPYMALVAVMSALRVKSS